jgi:hypothetical protein
MRAKAITDTLPIKVEIEIDSVRDLLIVWATLANSAGPSLRENRHYLNVEGQNEVDAVFANDSFHVANSLYPAWNALDDK